MTDGKASRRRTNEPGDSNVERSTAGATGDGDLEVAAIHRLFREFMDDAYGPEMDENTGTEFDGQDMLDAFAAGWGACYHARWEKVGGLPLGDSLKDKEG